MKKNTFLLLLILSLVFCISCENESILKVEAIVDEVIQEEPVSLKVINEQRELELKVNWGSVLQVEKEGISFQEYSISNYSKDHYKLVGVTEKDEATEYFVLLFIPRTGFDENMSYVEDMKGFSGTINWFDIKGDIVALEAYSKGTRINLTKSEEGKNSGGLTNKNDCQDGYTTWKRDLNSAKRLTARGPCGEAGFYATVIYHTWTDWYYNRGNLGAEYAYRTDYKRTYAREWVSTGRNYASSGGGGSTVTNRYGNQDSNSIIRDIATIERIEAEISPYPGCKSFDFEKVASEWQAACVKNLEFGVGTLTLNNGQIYRRKFPLFTFETWITDRFGNRTGANTAAAVAARAIQGATWDTVKHFQDEYDFTEYDIDRYFEKRLKRNFNDISGGGTVTRGNPYNLTPKQYETGGRRDCL